MEYSVDHGKTTVLVIDMTNEYLDECRAYFPYCRATEPVQVRPAARCRVRRRAADLSTLRSAAGMRGRDVSRERVTAAGTRHFGRRH